MSLFEQINNDIKAAMMAKEKEKLEALRAIKAAFLLAKAEKGEDLTSEREIQVVQKLVKQRLDTAEIYKTNQRAELAQKEEMEAAFISVYLPKQMTEAELSEAIKSIMTQIGASGAKDLGKVMGIASKQLAGKADGKSISACAKALLA